MDPFFLTDKNAQNSKTKGKKLLSSPSFFSVVSPKNFCANLSIHFSSICWQEGGHRRHPWSILGEEKNGIAEERAPHLSTPKLRYLYPKSTTTLHKDMCFFGEGNLICGPLCLYFFPTTIYGYFFSRSGHLHEV